MASFVFKLLLRCALWLVTRHRILHLRDWLASVAVILLLTGVGAWGFAVSSYRAIELSGLAGILSVDSLICMILLLVAFVPVTYIIKLRRLGITDADYSISTGIDYAAALSAVTKGFRFAGVAASKLRDREQEFREAIERTAKHRGEIRMLLVSPKSAKAIEEMEQRDATIAYREKIQGTQNFLSRLASAHSANMEIRYYEPADVDGMRPFRLFFSGEDCLLSPFVFGTGVKDQGRGLPQLRITSSGFPCRGLPTLFMAFEKYFDLEWRKAVDCREGADGQR